MAVRPQCSTRPGQVSTMVSLYGDVIDALMLCIRQPSRQPLKVRRVSRSVGPDEHALIQARERTVIPGPHACMCVRMLHAPVLVNQIVIVP